MIIVDTSALLAYVDSNTIEHEAVKAFIDANSRPLVLSPLVLAEIDYMVARLGPAAEIGLCEDVSAGRYRLAPFTDEDMARALEVLKQYQDLDIGLTDSSIAVLADRYSTTDLLTFDQHLRPVRPLGGDGAFNVLPADQADPH